MKNKCNVKHITDVIKLEYPEIDNNDIMLGYYDYIELDYYKADCGWTYEREEDFKGFTYCPNCGKLLA